LGRAFSTSYLAGEPSAHAFYPAGFRDAAERSRRVHLAAERSVAPAVLRVLAEQQARLPQSPARQAHLETLAKGGAAVVVTGQQVGLFLGPLYSFYKAASAVAVARALAVESGVPCVPLFWLQTEDHDFEEIRTCVVAGHDGEPVRLSLPDEETGQGRGSVAYRVLPAEVEGLLDRLAEVLGGRPATDETLTLLRAGYRPGNTLPAAFAATLAALFADEGLLLFDPRDARVAESLAPIHRVCLEDATTIEARLRQRTVDLAAAGFDAQVPIRGRGALSLFHRDAVTGPRFRLERLSEAGTGTWRLAGSGNDVAHAELLTTLDRAPLRFSTSALLRPIVEAAVLPGAAYVAGPGELNYFAQLPPLYAHFGLPPPLLVPRGRFLVVDARARRRLGLLGLRAADLGEPDLLARLDPVRPAGAPAPSELRALVDRAILPAVDEIAGTATAAAPHLDRPAARTRASVAHALEALIARYARALSERDEVTRRRLRGLERDLHPGRTPQERFYGWPHLAARHGPEGLKRLVADRLQTKGPFVTEVHELEP
jgi:bacillithiol biosynthesis cysteine-adding enzyme BshC